MSSSLTQFKISSIELKYINSLALAPRYTHTTHLSSAILFQIEGEIYIMPPAALHLWIYLPPLRVCSDFRCAFAQSLLRTHGFSPLLTSLIQAILGKVVLICYLLLKTNQPSCQSINCINLYLRRLQNLQRTLLPIRAKVAYILW